MIIKKGTVTKQSGDKTIKVEVREYQSHPKYKKRFLITTNFLAHDPEGKGKMGEEVLIRQCRPISKRKCWELVTDEISHS